MHPTESARSSTHHIEIFTCSSIQAPSHSNKKIKKASIGVIKALREHFGKKIGNKILKSKINDTKENIAAKKKNLEEAGFGSSIKIESADKKIVLDSFALHPKFESDKWIVIFNGMNSQYEKHLDALKKLAEDTNAHVLTFNYRGVGDSQILDNKGHKGRAKNTKDLVQDGEMLLEYLHSKGVNSKNIMLYGHSMGGGVAAELHDKMQHKGPLLSESSFSSFAAAVAAKKGKLMSFFIRLFGWNLKSMKAFENPQNKGIITNKRDPTIHYEKASLYKRVKMGLKEEEVLLRVKIGKHPKKEVKFGKKKNKAKTALEKHIVNSQLVEYRQTMRKIKEKKLLHQIQHPHQRVMDRIINQEKDSDTQQDQTVLRLRQDIHQEDLDAYRKILQLIELLWVEGGGEKTDNI
ncbi:serine aminopeptidase domain-containing protein [Parachlamydia acanthamoebae]|uniref:Serine aminopeptidase S33 domain-containing protein n=3 Tax=Parachlamydia acanthamoebae TaxID=83552 RepID=F8KZW9_PARAV|nr:alpha/beta hydrolase [Parachlamydia acanthamoebae]CCB86478.1 putative uncharacterized protein [Parachlamydia acanthamoebae UV-7]